MDYSIRQYFIYLLLLHCLSLVNYLCSAKPTSTGATSVEDWLNKIGLGRYWHSFQDNGYDIMGTLGGLNESTLDLLGVTLIGHRDLLLRKAKDVVTNN